MRRLALTLLVAAGLGWGCASSHKLEIREHDWKGYEPVGGWANYLPPKRDFKPSAARATAFGVMPDASTLSMQSTGLVMPTMGN